MHILNRFIHNEFTLILVENKYFEKDPESCIIWLLAPEWLWAGEHIHKFNKVCKFS